VIDLRWAKYTIKVKSRFGLSEINKLSGLEDKLMMYFLGQTSAI